MDLYGLELSHAVCPSDGLPLGRRFQLRFTDHDYGGCLDVQADTSGNDLSDEDRSVAGS